jgi:hypothetical protein
MKAKWIVESKYTTKKESYEFCKQHGLNPKNFRRVEDFNGVEISVIQENNKHGIKSYGYGGLDKIILFEGNDYTKKEMKWCEQVAKTICDTLNKEKL